MPHAHTQTEKTDRKKQKPKKGRVARLRPETWNLINDHRMEGESVDAVIRRLMELPPTTGETFYLLPDSLIAARSIAEARGKAILLAVAQGKKKPQEKPILVRAMS